MIYHLRRISLHFSRSPFTACNYYLTVCIYLFIVSLPLALSLHRCLFILKCSICKQGII